jgi:broad specificity phosphatase PhoE
MTRIVLIRPGSTDYDEQDRIQGTLDIPLNDRGAEEAAQTAESLRTAALHRIFSCPDASSNETARVIGKALGIRVRKLDKLHNLNQGLWQGLQVEEVRRKHPKVYRQWREEPTTVCPPSGETVTDAYNRVAGVMKPLLKRHRDEAIGLVVPEPLASVIRCYLRGIDLKQVWESGGTDGRWQVIELGDANAPPAVPATNPAQGPQSP